LSCAGRTDWGADRKPTELAGRTPEKRDQSRDKSEPSVIEITLCGYKRRRPGLFSMIGSAVTEHRRMPPLTAGGAFE